MEGILVASAVDSTHRPTLVSPEIWRDGKRVSKEIGSNRRMDLNVSPFLFDRLRWSQPQCATPYPMQGSCQNHRIPTDGPKNPTSRVDAAGSSAKIKHPLQPDDASAIECEQRGGPQPTEA